MEGRSPILVLVNPQDIVNIASAVRVAKNFGIKQMRLVNPEVFDPYRIEGIAHNTADFVATIQIMDSLEAAIADCVFTVVLPARGEHPSKAAPQPVGSCLIGAAGAAVHRLDRGALGNRFLQDSAIGERDA